MEDHGHGDKAWGGSLSRRISAARIMVTEDQGQGGSWLGRIMVGSKSGGSGMGKIRLSKIVIERMRIGQDHRREG